MPAKSSRDVIKDLKADGWKLVRVTESHHHFKHPKKPGLVTVPHPKRDLPPKTLANIYKAAGLPAKLSRQHAKKWPDFWALSPVRSSLPVAVPRQTIWLLKG